MSSENEPHTDSNGTTDKPEKEEYVEKSIVREFITKSNKNQDRLEELSEQVEKNSQSLDYSEGRIAMAQLAEAITDRDVSKTNDMVQSSRVILDEFQKLREQVDDLEEWKESYGVGKARDQDEAWVQIVNAARNKKGNLNHQIKDSTEVSLFIENIETATGYSDRHCSNLIEKYGENKRGCRWRPYQEASAENKNNSRRKQLIIDLDIWGESS